MWAVATVYAAFIVAAIGLMAYAIRNAKDDENAP